MIDYPKVTMCMITERRPEFMPFFAFCWNRLDWPGEKELAVVTTKGNEESLEILKNLIPENEQNFDISLEPGGTVGSLRNRVKTIATGEWVTWGDDDDWFAPFRLREVWEVIMTHTHRKYIQVMGMASDVPLLHIGLMRVKPRPRAVWWAGGFVKLELAQKIRFLDLNVGEDGLWFIKVCQVAGEAHKHAVQRMATHGDMILCLEHGKNVSVGADSDEGQYWPLTIPKWFDEESRQEVENLKERLEVSSSSLAHLRRKP
jgi:hypothetical protein